MMRILFVCLSVWAEDCINVKYIEFVGSTEPVLWIRLFRCSFSQFGFGAVRVSVVYRFPFVYVYAIDALTFTVSFSTQDTAVFAFITKVSRPFTFPVLPTG